MAGRFSLPIVMESDENGVPGSGWQLFFYESETSTPLDTYSDDALTTANTNPVVADSNGRFGDIFLQGDDYKVILKDENNVTIWTADPVRSSTQKTSVVLAKSTSYTVTADDDGKLIAADATGGAFTITLPAAATAGDGFEISVIKIDSSSNAVTIDGDGSETINDESDLVLSSQFDSAVLRSDGSEWFATTRPTSTTTPLPRGYIDGLVISNNGTDSDHDIDIAAGTARDGGDAANLTLSTTLTKQIDAAWAVGDGNGGLDTGTVANDTWYHVWIIRRSDTGVTDALFSTSATAPTMPTNYDQKRRIGAVLTDGSANIRPFTQHGDKFRHNSTVLDYTQGTPGTSAITVTLDYVPTGVVVDAHIFAQAEDGGTQQALLITALTDSDQTPGATDGLGQSSAAASAEGQTGELFVPTNTSAQIRARVLSSSASANIRIYVRGWIDPRGRNA